MEQTIYIKFVQCTDIKNTNVTLKDFASVYCTDQATKEKVLSIPFHTFEKGKKQQLVVSVLKIIEIVTKEIPDADIQTLGEEDFILNYSPQPKNEKIKENIFTFFICLVAFFGGGYAIMAYNTDAGAKELFTHLSMLFVGNATSGVACLVITYSVGLTVGMILFFNHFGQKKLTTDPTPLEVQMRLYEKDISTTVIKDLSRRGENMDVNE